MLGKRKMVTSIVAVVLICSIIISTVYYENDLNIQVRNIELEVPSEYEHYFSEYEEKEMTYDETTETVGFYGKVAYSGKEDKIFDNVSMEEEITDDNIIYECTFDMNTMMFHFMATLINENEEVIDIYEMDTEAIVTEDGRLDACIEIAGETYLLSDYKNTEIIDNCVVGFILGAIVIYVVMAERAEQKRAEENFKYNKKLETDGKGVKKGVYITDQTEVSVSEKKAGNYRFGFTMFGNVGCEVAATYNTMISIGWKEMLSSTIYYFEKMAIEFAVGFGSLGSNPYEISRYLDFRGILYTKYYNYDSFKKAVEGKNSCRIIMSRWNSNKSTGLHTFFVRKQSKSVYMSYNWKGDKTYKKSNNINELNNGSGFIVGYIIGN